MRGWRDKSRYKDNLQRTASRKIKTGQSAMVGQGGRRRCRKEPGGGEKKKMSL